MLGSLPLAVCIARSLGSFPWLVVWILHEGGEAEDPHQAGGAHPSASEKGRAVGAQNHRRGAQGCPNVALVQLQARHMRKD